ncbi:7-carboxy-7-deazaguanine synthase [Candidatus Tiddalikarchaeum anstoanum]|nr:7-carboxy-7-deazaguanine synthase [Candidatus Tiddalikarchaeum anstoanum]
MHVFIAGVQEVSSIDYPEHLASVVFLQGCNLRCKFCHNSKDMVPKKKEPLISIYKKLNKNLQVIDSVVLSGGEPTLQENAVLDIKDWCKKHGLKLGIETNGTFPARLKRLVEKNTFDFIAMDIKSAFNAKSYNLVTGNNKMFKQFEKSFEMVKKSRIPHEFRMTVVPTLHTLNDIEGINKIVKPSKLVLQRFKPGDTVYDKALNNKTYPETFVKDLKTWVKKNKNVEMRFWD